MLVCDYIVESIDGDYAHLRRTDLPEEELKLVARALLPFDITDHMRGDSYYEYSEQHNYKTCRDSSYGCVMLCIFYIPAD